MLGGAVWVDWADPHPANVSAANARAACRPLLLEVIGRPRSGDGRLTSTRTVPLAGEPPSPKDLPYHESRHATWDAPPSYLKPSNPLQVEKLGSAP